MLTADSHTAKLFRLPEKEYWTAGKLVFAKDLECEQENLKITSSIFCKYILTWVYINIGLFRIFEDEIGTKNPDSYGNHIILHIG